MKVSNAHKQKPGKGTPLTGLDRVERMAEVSRLSLLDYPVSSIAAAVNLSVNQVYKLLKEISDQYVTEMVKDRESLVARKLVEFKQLRFEAWQAYLRSKQDAEEEREEHALRLVTSDDEENDEQQEKGGKRKGKWGRNGKALKPQTEFVKVKHVKMKKGRLPGQEYLRIILDTYKEEIEMFGLREAVKVDVRAQVIDWSVFNVATAPQRDVIDLKIQEELDRSLPLDEEEGRSEPAPDETTQRNGNGHYSREDDESQE